MKILLLPLFCAFLLAGCASLQTQRDPSANLGRVKTVFVESRLGDDHRLNHLIAAELEAMGLQVTTGPSTMQPDHVDAVVSYTDRWEWDFKSYLIEFHLTVRDGISDKLLASVAYYRPSVISKTPEKMLHEILPPLFKNRGGKSLLLITPLRDPDIPDSVRTAKPAAKP